MRPSFDSNVGNDIDDNGIVLSAEVLSETRRKKGLCLTCGRKCYERKYLKMVPLTINGEVHKGRCLLCRPLTETNTPMVASRKVKRLPQQLNQGSGARSLIVERTPPALKENGRLSTSSPPKLSQSFQPRAPIETPTSPRRGSDNGSVSGSMPSRRGEGSLSKSLVVNPTSPSRGNKRLSASIPPHLNQNHAGSLPSGVNKRLSASMPPHLNQIHEAVQEDSFGLSQGFESSNSDRPIDEKNSVEEELFIMRASGLDGTFQVMLMNRKNPIIQEEGSRIMTSLMIENDQVIEDIGYMGGLELVSENLEGHTSNKRVQESVLETLFYLSKSSGNCTWMIKVGAVKKILTSMKRHTDSSKVILHSTGLLSNLVLQNEIAKSQILQEQGLEYIQGCLYEHIDNQAVFKSICRICELLGYSL